MARFDLSLSGSSTEVSLPLIGQLMRGYDTAGSDLPANGVEPVTCRSRPALTGPLGPRMRPPVLSARRNTGRMLRCLQVTVSRQQAANPLSDDTLADHTRRLAP
jgi:hypothetical protein